MHAPEHDPDFPAGEGLRYRRPADEPRATHELAREPMHDAMHESVHEPLHDSRHEPAYEPAYEPPYEQPYEPVREPARAPRRPSALAMRLREPRTRALAIAGAALLLLLAIALAWYADPTNRARRELAQANSRIVKKQQEVDDARRLLERRLAELRAARADADVYATVYRGVLEREGRADERAATPLDASAAAPGTTTSAGEVALPPVAPQGPATRPRP